MSWARSRRMVRWWDRCDCVRAMFEQVAGQAMFGHETAAILLSLQRTGSDLTAVAQNKLCIPCPKMHFSTPQLYVIGWKSDPHNPCEASTFLCVYKIWVAVCKGQFFDIVWAFLGLTNLSPHKLLPGAFLLGTVSASAKVKAIAACSVVDLVVAANYL